MRTLLLLVFLILFGKLHAQVLNKAEYFIDTDPGVGNATLLTVSPPSAFINQTFSIPIGSLSSGFHIVGLRLQNSIMKAWSIPSYQMFYVWPTATFATSISIVRAEYFLDVDPGIGNATPLAIVPSAIQNLSFTVPSNSLAAGFHTLHVRVLDNTGKWSIAQVQTFYIVPSVSVNFSSSLSRAEYFFDTDPGNGNGVSVPFLAAPNFILPLTIPTSTLTPGFHTLHFRTRDDKGRWSIAHVQSFYIVGNSIVSSSTIRKAEYFFDTDPGQGNGTTLSIIPGTSQANTFAIPVAGLSDGFHSLNIRYRDDQAPNRWSHVFQQTFYITKLVSTKNLDRIEYFVDVDPGFGSGTAVSFVGAPTLNQTFALDLSGVPAGSHTMNIRVKDSDGYWSEITSAPFLISSCTPPPTPTVIDFNRCDVGSVTLSANGATGTQVYRWYADATTTFLLTSEPSFVTPSLLSSQVFYVAIFDPITACESLRRAINVTIEPLPTAPSILGSTVCSNNAAVLQASGASNGSYRWYTVPVGGNPLSGEVNGTFTSPTLTSTTTYYVSIVNGNCESLRTPVTATIATVGCIPPTITSQVLTTQIGGLITLDLEPLIQVSEGSLDFASIAFVLFPTSGAASSIVNGVLTLDYSGIAFSGVEAFSIRACDTNGNCTTQQFEVEVIGDVVVYNALSPNGDELNERFILEFIDAISITKNNKVSIFNRWGALVWQGEDYNNEDVVFRGISKTGNELPSGVYFYKVEFSNAAEIRSGFIQLKR